MTLLELSAQYRIHAGILKKRLVELNEAQEQAITNHDQLQLEHRIRILQTMWREAQDLAVFTEHYYERGYHRNAKYTI